MKDIFENDICRYEETNYVVKRQCEIPGEYWAETGFVLKEIGTSRTMYFTDTIDSWCNEIVVEIIGNIHDNPELL